MILCLCSIWILDFCFNKWLIFPFYLLTKGIASNSYCHSSVIRMVSSFTFSASSEYLTLFACSNTFLTSSGWMVFQILYKYDLSHYRPFGNLSGKYLSISGYLIILSYKALTPISSYAGGLQNLTSLIFKKSFFPDTTLLRWSLVSISKGGK